MKNLNNTGKTSENTEKELCISDVIQQSEQFFCCVVENGQEKCKVQCHFCKDWVEDAE